MEIIHGLHNLKIDAKGCVLTIGNFDGVHRGHQAVLQRLKNIAKKLNCSTMLMTFEPHPKEFFHPENAVSRLSNLREKMILLETFGLDKVLVIPFNQTLVALTAKEFITKLLVSELAINYLLVGEDFQFGHQREGNLALLKLYAEKHSFTVEPFSAIKDRDLRISSTQIRQCLADGDFKQAKILLGYDYFMAGRVSVGDQRGRTINFPTLNIPLKRLQSPIKGVFAVTVTGIEAKPMPGVANLGTRPTVDGLKILLEVHLFDFDKIIYGQHVKVHFQQKIRDEKKFASFDELRKQIAQDAEVARKILKVS